jgi:hypothetical protein
MGDVKNAREPLGSEALAKLWENAEREQAGLAQKDMEMRSPELARLMSEGGGVYRDSIDPKFVPTIEKTYQGALDIIGKVRHGEDRKLLQDSLENVAYAHDMTAEIPDTREEAEQFITRLGEQKQALEGNLKSLENALTFRQDEPRRRSRTRSSPTRSQDRGPRRARQIHPHLRRRRSALEQGGRPRQQALDRRRHPGPFRGAGEPAAQ